jgi:tRNA(Ile)-lysidine synthase
VRRLSPPTDWINVLDLRKEQSLVVSPTSYPPADWPHRWARLANACRIEPELPLLLALSGGADSVFLLHLLARANPRPRFVAMHVNHHLRGAESLADARFCEALATEVGAPFVLANAPLDAASPDLERFAREARYGALRAEARRRGIGVIVTGHHSDDALETLMIRWMRGTALAGLAGLARRTPLGHSSPEPSTSVDVVRPLLDLRGAEIRQRLRLEELAWREDSSNRSASFTRNRVRNLWLPEIARICGAEAIASLRCFHDAVRSFEHEVARRTAHIVWSPPLHAAAQRSARSAHLGGCIERQALMTLPAPLLRRTLWRLIGEGCGHHPSRSLLDALEEDLLRGRCTSHSVGGAWVLQLRSERVHLSPPIDEEDAAGERPLPVPGSVELADGRSITAEIREVRGDPAVPRSLIEVELEVPDSLGELTVRCPRPGDRFRGLGAPGSRPLGRFLADAGIPRVERRRIPLVLLDEEILWVAGVRPGDRHRVREGSRRRLRLRLNDAAPSPHSLGGGDFVCPRG